MPEYLKSVAMRQKSLRFSQTSFFHMAFLYDKDEFHILMFYFLDFDFCLEWLTVFGVVS